jgi:hypothetical protein
MSCVRLSPRQQYHTTLALRVRKLQKTWDDPDVFLYTPDMEEVYALLQEKVPSYFHGQTSVVLFLADSIVEVKMPRVAVLYYPKFLQMCQDSIPGFGMEVNQAWSSWAEIRESFLRKRLEDFGLRFLVEQDDETLILRAEVFGEGSEEMRSLIQKVF